MRSKAAANSEPNRSFQPAGRDFAMFRRFQRLCSDRQPPSSGWLRGRNARKRRLLCAVAVLLGLAAPGPRGVAQAPVQVSVINREYSIKATFLYHFSSYITWPPDALPAKDQPFVIAIFYADPFGVALDEIARTKTVAGRPIVIRRVTTPKELTGCHIVFIPRNTPAEHQALALSTTSGAAVLVVGESDDFIQRGGGAQFFVEGNKVRFAFRADVAEGGKLKISSKLLSLAKIIPAP